MLTIMIIHIKFSSCSWKIISMCHTFSIVFLGHCMTTCITICFCIWIIFYLLLSFSLKFGLIIVPTMSIKSIFSTIIKRIVFSSCITVISSMSRSLRFIFTWIDIWLTFIACCVTISLWIYMAFFKFMIIIIIFFKIRMIMIMFF